MTTAEALADLRPYLMRVALSRMRDSNAAEEVVQETLAAAIVGSDSFRQRSRLRTWATGILLHKVADAFRAARRDLVLHANALDADGEDDIDFDAQGTWRAPVTSWSDPQRALECKRFGAEFERQLAKLPEMQSRAFVMREVMGLESDEICATLGVTSSNLWVLLHRARLALRGSLDRDWFAAS